MERVTELTEKDRKYLAELKKDTEGVFGESQLRRRVYFVLNSARTYNNFVYCRALYSKNDFKIQVVKDDEQRIGMVFLPKDAIIYGHKKSMTEKYKARYEC